MTLENIGTCVGESIFICALGSLRDTESLSDHHKITLDLYVLIYIYIFNLFF